MKKKVLSILLCMAMLSSLAVGCGGKENSTKEDNKKVETEKKEEIDTEASMVIPVEEDVVSLNMLQNCLTETGLAMLGSLHDHLLTVNLDGSLNYYLAQNLEISEDGTVYTLTLNKDAKWHDGTPVTADDVIFTYDALKAGAINPQLSAAVTLDEKPIIYEKVDDVTVKFTLPRASNIYVTTLGMLYLVPKHVYENIPTDQMDTCKENLEGWGNGPYKYKEYIPGEKLVVERNDDYYRGKPSYKTIEYRIMPDSTAQEVAFLNGEIDYFRVKDAETLEKYENNDKYSVHKFPEGRINYMQINKHSTPLATVEAREALVKALNIEEIVAGAYGSEELAKAATGTVICAGEVNYNEDVENYKQDLEQAKKLVKETGLDKKPIKLVYNNNRAGMEEVALIIQQQLKKAGIECKLEGIDSSAFFELFFFNPTQDAWDIGLNGYQSSGRANYCSWYIDGSYFAQNCHTSEELNELWYKADVSTENTEEAYNEVSKMLQSYYTFVPITNTNKVVVTPANSKGWEDSARKDLSDYMTLYKTK